MTNFASVFSPCIREYSNAHGAVTGHDLLDILRLLGIRCEQEAVRALVPSWDDIDYETVTDVIEQLSGVHGTDTRVRQIAKQVAAVEYVGMWHYLWLSLPCTAKPADVVYALKPFELRVPPQVLDLRHYDRHHARDGGGAHRDARVFVAPKCRRSD